MAARSRASKPPKPLYPHLPPLETIQLGPDIEVKIQGLVFVSIISTGIKVNDIVDLGPAAIHNPVVSVEWWLIPHPGLPSCPRRQTGAQAIETRQLGSTAGLGATARLPRFDLMPCALIDSVVYGHDDFHVGGLRIVRLASHGIEEHLLRGVDPVPRRLVGGGIALTVCGMCGRGGGRRGGECAGDGADFAVGAQAGVREEAGGCRSS